MGRKKNYTDVEFIDAVATSQSIAELLRKLNLRPTGGNYHTAKKRIKILELNTDHFTRQGHLKGKTHNWAKKIPLIEILVKDSKYGCGTDKLKKRLIKEGYFEYKCYECGLTEWRGLPISLELEHRNGDRFDNRIENLTLLCPNCHAQTETYRGKNIKKEKQEEKHCSKCGKKISKYGNKSGLCVCCVKQTKINNIKECKDIKKCSDCGDIITKRSKTGLCLKCSHKLQYKVKNRPSKEELEELLKINSYCAIGRMFGVSDNAIRKWLKQ